jgi:hypothetical protein
MLRRQFLADRYLLLAPFGSHKFEHTAIMVRFPVTGEEGPLEFLTTGGHLSIGLLLLRPDLNFLYNLIETTPLLLSYF